MWVLLHRGVYGHPPFKHLQRASFDTDLVVYEGNCFQKTQVGCNGDNENCDDFTSELTCPVQEGQQYLIRVGGWESGNSGSGILLIECE